MANNKRQIPKEELEQLYTVECKSLKTIGALYGVNAQTVLNRLREYDIPSRTSGEHKLGKPHSQEHREKIAQALKGKPLTEERKKKISTAHKGKHLTPEHIAKISGQNSPCWGRSGDKHPMWKGGVSTEQNRLRQSYQYKLWRTSVFKRDAYVCRVCKNKPPYVQAHHIVRFGILFAEQNWTLMWDIDNGLTLCRPCHRKIHKGEIDLWQYIHTKNIN